MGNETVSRSRAASRPGLKTIDIVLLVIAAALVIVGTAVLWNIRSDLISASLIPDSDAGRSRYNWDLIVFWLVWLACAASVLLGKNSVLPVIAAGLLFLLAMLRTGNNYGSVGFINYCRVLNDDSATSADHWKKCTSGGIIAYLGVLLAILTAFFGFSAQANKPDGGASLYEKLLLAVSVVFALIGVVVLYTSKSAGAINNSDYTQTFDTTVDTILAVLYTLAGTFNGNTALRAGAGFVSSLVFVFFFHDMFDTAGDFGATENRQIYAGYLFCWFSTIVNMIVVTLQFWNVAA